MSSEVAREEITEHKIGMRHSELAIRFLREGEDLVDRGDVIQASEKLYKAAEEAIKEQAGIHAHAKDVYAEAERRGRWNTTLLFKAARILGKEIRHYWDSAWTLHVEGFHEAKLDLEEVKERLEDIKRLVGSSKSW